MSKSKLIGETGTFLDYKECIKEFSVEQDRPDFELIAGLFRGSSPPDQFGFIIKDRRFDEPKIYVKSFACSFCSENKQDWFAQVMIRQMMELIKESHRVTIDEINNAQRKLDNMLSM